MRTIKDMPEHSRPREKPRDKGASALTDEELVAAILGMGTAGIDVRTIAREVLSFLVGRELLSPEWAERLLFWRHTGFNLHSLVRTKTKWETERVGKSIIRPMLALERLTFVAAKPPPSYVFAEVALAAAERAGNIYEYFVITGSGSLSPIGRCGEVFRPKNLF